MRNIRSSWNEMITGAATYFCRSPRFSDSWQVIFYDGEGFQVDSEGFHSTGAQDMPFLAMNEGFCGRPSVEQRSVPPPAVKAQLIFRQADGFDHGFNIEVFQSRHVQIFADPFDHSGIFRRTAIKIRCNVIRILSFDGPDGASGSQLRKRAC